MPAAIGQVAAYGHGQHAGLGRQQPAGPAASAFDEIFQRVAARRHHREVLGEDGRIERIAAESAPDKERATLAQQPTDDRQVEVDAGGNVGHGHAALIDDVGEQHIVHVAAVAGQIDDLCARLECREALGVPDLDAGV